jgi:hypothetical protein
MTRDKYFIYPRNKDGKRTGHTICVLLKDGKMFHGTALCSADDQFSRAEGRELAELRALEAYVKHKARLEFYNG